MQRTAPMVAAPQLDCFNALVSSTGLNPSRKEYESVPVGASGYVQFQLNKSKNMGRPDYQSR